MSSHHFVREGQEPPLYLESFIDADLIGTLLEWSPQVLVGQAALESYLLTGRKMDVVVADAATLERLNPALEAQYPLEVISGETEDLQAEAVLSWCQKNALKSITLCTTRASFWRNQLYDRDLQIVLLDDQLLKWHRLSPGKHRKWFRAGTLHFDPSHQVRQGDAYLPQVFQHQHDGFIDFEALGSCWVGESV